MMYSIEETDGMITSIIEKEINFSWCSACRQTLNIYIQDITRGLVLFEKATFQKLDASGERIKLSYNTGHKCKNLTLDNKNSDMILIYVGIPVKKPLII